MSDSVGLERGLRMCISNKFQSKADAALGTIMRTTGLNEDCNVAPGHQSMYCEHMLTGREQRDGQ